MAEQLAEVFPEGVVCNPETGEPEGVSLYGLITGVVGLCRCQQEELETLKTRVAEMENN